MVSTLLTASSTAVAVTWLATVSATATASASTRQAAIATTAPRGPGRRERTRLERRMRLGARGLMDRMEVVWGILVVFGSKEGNVLPTVVGRNRTQVGSSSR